jgi:hypothetical protein
LAIKKVWRRFNVKSPYPFCWSHVELCCRFLLTFLLLTKQELEEDGEKSDRHSFYRGRGS